MKCFDGAGSAVTGASGEVIQRVFKPIVFVTPLIAGPDAAENDHAVRHFNHLVGVHDDAAGGKFDGEWFRGPKRLVLAGANQRLYQTIAKCSIIRSIGMLDWTFLSPKTIKFVHRFGPAAATGNTCFGKPTDKLVDAVVCLGKRR